MFDPESYTISVRKECIEGDILYVARVYELADVVEYADSFEDARALALDTISIARELSLERGLAFPSPQIFSSNEASGRVTLRMPKTLHSNLIQEAEKEDVSLNQLIVLKLTSSYERSSERISILNTVKNMLVPHFNNIATSIQDIQKQTIEVHSYRRIQSESIEFTPHRRGAYSFKRDLCENVN